MTGEQIFSEIFPLRLEALPALTAYRPVYRLDATPLTRREGQRLAARLADLLGGGWYWHGGHALTDTSPNPARLVVALDAISADAAAFAGLETLEADRAYSLPTEAIAAIALALVVPPWESALAAALSRTIYAVKNALVERSYLLTPWTVDKHPALALSITSQVLAEQPLTAYLTALEKPADAVGARVTDRISQRSGAIARVLGPLGDHHARLSATAAPALRALIDAADAAEPVLRVRWGETDYDTLGAALHLIIQPEDAERFGLTRAAVEAALHLHPRLRAEIVKILSDVLKTAGLIGTAYSTATAPHLFTDSAPQVRVGFGGSKQRDYDADRLPYDFEKFGAYRPARSAELRITILNAHPQTTDVDDFLEALRRLLGRAFQQAITIVRERKVRVPSPANLDSGVRALDKEAADLMLVFLPDSAAAEEAGSVSETASGRLIKGLTLGRQHPCLIVTESIMHTPEAMLNVIMGISARAGQIPYALAEPLAFADRVIGLMVTRTPRKERDAVLAFARLYRADGVLLRWIAARRVVRAGAPVPVELLADVLPKASITSKRVIIHTSGLSRAVQRELGAWEDETGASFFPVSMTAGDAPRLYALRDGGLQSPTWGTMLRLGANDALIVTTAAALRGDALPTPLHVRTEPPLTIEQAAHSVMAFTLFHYGARHKPRLPVTLHNSDLLEEALKQGPLLPTSPDEVTISGENPFWL